MSASPIIVNEIRRLSQEEGLKDGEIAAIIQYRRETIQRIRKEAHIPNFNKERRKDKKVICANCGASFLIRRCENFHFCEECTTSINARCEERRVEGC